MSVTAAALRVRSAPLLKLSEREVQRGAIRLLAMSGVYAVHVPNGVQLPGDELERVKRVAALKADGVSPGFPDLVLIDNRAVRPPALSRMGLIEVKREGKRTPDPDQVWWRDELQRLGIPWALIDTPEGALDAIKTWGWRP